MNDLVMDMDKDVEVRAGEFMLVLLFECLMTRMDRILIAFTLGGHFGLGLLRITQLLF